MYGYECIHVALLSCITFFVSDSEKMRALTEGMKHKTDPVQIREGMKATALYRRELIHKQDGPDLRGILDIFPHLLERGMVWNINVFFLRVSLERPIKGVIQT